MTLVAVWKVENQSKNCLIWVNGYKHAKKSESKARDIHVCAAIGRFKQVRVVSQRCPAASKASLFKRTLSEMNSAAL